MDGHRTSLRAAADAATRVVGHGRASTAVTPSRRADPLGSGPWPASARSSRRSSPRSTTRCASTRRRSSRSCITSPAKARTASSSAARPARRRRSTDEEHLGLIELAVRERPDGTSIIAGVGSNDTRHAVAPDRHARASSAPTRCCRSTRTTTAPTGAGSSPTTARSRARPTARSCSTTSRSARARTCPTTCSPSSRSSITSARVKQANNDNLALVDGLDLYAGNDDMLARTLDLGGAGGILVASHIVGPRDAPHGRRARAAAPRSTPRCRTVYDGARRSGRRR